MDQRAGCSSLYLVICPRCESLSSVEESVCPFCGADRHGAVLTKGAETSLRAVEAARGVTRHFQAQDEVARVRWTVRPRRREPRLPAPASASASAAAVMEPHRASNSILATVAMGGIVIGACFLIRAYFDQHSSMPRAGTLPVAVVGSVGQAAPKADVPPQRIVEAPSRASTNPPVETASPLIAVAASSDDHTREAVVSERPVAAKPSATRVQHSSKASSKTVSKAVSKVASKPVAACAHKTGRACTEQPQRRVASAEPKHRQANKSPNPPPVARAKTGTKEFQKVAAIPSPVKPAMTADGSWKPGKAKN